MDELKGMPVAVQTAAANEQHYEVRAAADDATLKAFVQMLTSPRA